MDRRTPVCRPLQTLADVCRWLPGRDGFCVAQVPRADRRRDDGPRTLVCHDMKGGYLEDRLIQGCGKSDMYHFYHWQFVDTFVYFSHHLVTIPPPTWTNAAHRHGVSVLGTVITEWDDGKKNCGTFLESEGSYKSFADKLVKMAKYYRFDGWLINIENIIEPSEMVGRLRDFVKYLTEEQHKHDPSSLVIWYDSVLDSGKLDWQNALNESNSLFFDVCDGIFLNYCWTVDQLADSKTVATGKSRPYDVYVGIDVYGRGCLGGGGFNTSEALEAVRKHNLSAAIFAAGWTYEKLGGEDFIENEEKFWRLLHGLCYTRCLTSLPLTTTFCQGQGPCYHLDGIKTGGPWANLSVQQLQPAYRCEQFDDYRAGPRWGSPTVRDQVAPHMDVHTEDAYNGGSCLKLQADVSLGNFVNYKLFPLAVDLKQYTAVYVSLTYKVIQDPDCDLYLKLDLKHGDRSIVLVLIPFDVGEYLVPTYSGNTSSFTVPFLNKLDIPGCLQKCYHGNMNRWKTRWFKIHDLYLKFCQLKLVSVGLTTSDPQSKKCIALLGDLRIVPTEDIPNAAPIVEFVSADYDQSPSTPLLDVGTNKLDFYTGQCNETGDDRLIAKGDNCDHSNNGGKDVSVEGDKHVESITQGDNTDHANGHDKGRDSTKEDNCADIVIIKGDKADDHTGYWDKCDDFVGASVGHGCMIIDDGVDCLKVPYDHLDKSRIYYQVTQDVANKTADGKHISKHAVCLDCFTIRWSVPASSEIQYYRIFQLLTDSHAAIIGQTVMPFYKVTWFKIPYSARDEVIQHFRFVVQPVTRCGLAVPLNDLEIFGLACNKDAIKRICDSSTTMGSDMRRDVKLSVKAGHRVKVKSGINEDSAPETKMSKNGQLVSKCPESTTTDKSLMTDLGQLTSKGQVKGQTQLVTESGGKSPVKGEPTSAQDTDLRDGHTERKRHIDSVAQLEDSTKNLHIDETTAASLDVKTE